jgi:hypothetical protein
MKGTEPFECVPLRAKLSPLQCLVNRVKALALVKYPGIGPRELRPCLKCEVGRRVRAYLPAGDQP